MLCCFNAKNFTTYFLSSSLQTTPSMQSLEKDVTDLKSELQATQNQLSKVKATLEFKDEELARKSDELNQLNSKVKVIIA